MPTRQIATSTLWQIGSQVAMAALSAITVKFVALGLSKELAGAYNSAYGYLQIFAILADFGLYAVSVKEVSKAKPFGPAFGSEEPSGSEREGPQALNGNPARILAGLLTIRVGITILSLGSAVVIAFLVPAWHGTPLRSGIAIASLVPFFTLLAGVLRTTFQVTYKMHYVFIAEVLQRVVTASAMGLIILQGIRGSNDISIYQLFLWVGPLGSFVLLFLSFVFAFRLMPVKPCFEWPLLRRLLRLSAPYGVAFLCIALYRQFDLTLIALLRPDFAIQNAEYGFALRLGEMTYLLPTFLLNSALPVLSLRREQGVHAGELLGKTLLVILILGSISSLFSFFWGRPLMQLLTTDAYLSSAGDPGADTALRFLSLPMFLNGIVLFSFYVLLTEHRWKALVTAMLLAVAISLSFNFSLIPYAGFLGAIATLTVVHVFLCIVLFPLALKTMPVHFPSIFLLKWILLSVILGLLLWFSAPILVGPQSTLIGCIIGGLFTVILMFMFSFHRMLFLAKVENTPFTNLA